MCFNFTIWKEIPQSEMFSFTKKDLLRQRPIPMTIPSPKHEKRAVSFRQIGSGYYQTEDVFALRMSIRHSIGQWQRYGPLMITIIVLIYRKSDRKFDTMTQSLQMNKTAQILCTGFTPFLKNCHTPRNGVWQFFYQVCLQSRIIALSCSSNLCQLSLLVALKCASSLPPW